MAKSALSPVAGIAIPPVGSLDITIVTLPRNKTLLRVHESKFAATNFNPGFGNARFSPIFDSNGDPIPTIYAGDTQTCALMESIFHEIPYVSPKPVFEKAKLVGLTQSLLRLDDTLRLVDLRTIALRKLCVQRNQLIDTESDQYHITRKWAEAFHAQFPDIQGALWTSRQDDDSQAVVLFGDRIAPTAISQLGASRSLDVEIYPDVLRLADRIGVQVVDVTI